MSRPEPDTHLRDLAEQFGHLEKFFEPLHFDYWQEPTTDCVRKARWLYRLPAFASPDDDLSDELSAPYRLVLSVNYELAIDDAPDVPTSANFDYCFEGVSLELRAPHTDEPVGTMPLRITTTDGLKAFLASFPPHPKSRPSAPC